MVFQFTGKTISLSVVLTMLAMLISSTFAFVSSPAAAQSTEANVNVTSNYDSSYKEETPILTKPVTIDLQSHLYHPGDSVRVHGTILDDIVKQVNALDVVKVEVKDNAGNVVARENATVNKADDSYSSSLSISDSAAKGTYTAESRVELDADALGIVKAITSATLQSSMQFAVAAPVDYPVNAEAKNFTVSIASNSGINDFQFKQSDKRVSFFVEGDAGTIGVTEITIPKAMLSGDMSVFIDQNLVNDQDVIVKSDTDAVTTFEINYHHSIHRMEVAGTNVVPEFSVASVSAVAIAGGIGLIVALTRTWPPMFRIR
jgi:hypothetical protein